HLLLFYLLLPQQPPSTLFPYTTLFRSILQNAQQLRLQFDGHVADLVEKKRAAVGVLEAPFAQAVGAGEGVRLVAEELVFEQVLVDRKSTRLNSSHVAISYAVFCLKKKK